MRFLAVLFAAFAAIGFLRWRGPAFDRPFDEDEWLTVSVYTWAELRPDGEPQPLSRIEDWRALPRPTAGQAALGVWAALGRWPEPNNHIVHSVLVNGSQMVERSERWARLPALLGGLAFAGAMAWLCWGVLGWRFAAPLVAAWAWWWPHCVAFSQSARGYSWSLALPALWLIAAHGVVKRPDSLWRATLCAALAVLAFLNLVSLAVLWVLPAYAALWWTMKGQRKVVLAQALAVGAVGLTFLLAHLPEVASSARQYGDPFSWPGVAGVIDHLFPGWPMKLFAAAGLAGVVLMARSEKHRFVGLLCLGVVAVSLAYSLATRRLPYPRAMGVLLLPAFLGAAYLVELMVEAWRPLLGAAALGFALCVPGGMKDVRELEYERFLDHLGEVGGDVPTVRFTGESVDAAADLYRPADWDAPAVLVPGQAAQACFLLKKDDPMPPGTVELEVEEYRLARLKGRVRRYDEGSGAALVFWYPDPERLGVGGRGQRATAEASSARHVVRTTRYRAKMQVYGRLHALVFIAVTEADRKSATRLVAEGLERYGGSAATLVAE
ncbi:MAG: hypothetical protein K2W96_27945 [Gemmataceae bacterium]|nr:hypothetical protein [Gemmataceae bacterium]